MDHYKTWQLHCPSHGYYLILHWGSSLGNIYFGKFSLKIWDVFFQGQTLFWPYLRNGWSDRCETKRKCIGWILDTICDLDLWPNSWPWPWMFQGQIQNSSFSGIVGLIDVKWKWSELIWYWADCMTLPIDHTHDLNLGVEISRSESEIALSQEWDIRLTWNKKDMSHPFMTMILTSVTMVGWADVPDSDWGDFRRRLAIDISSSLCRVSHLLTNCLSFHIFAVTLWLNFLNNILALMHYRHQYTMISIFWHIPFMYKISQLVWSWGLLH